jgi:hypothetical protein
MSRRKENKKTNTDLATELSSVNITNSLRLQTCNVRPQENELMSGVTDRHSIYAEKFDQQLRTEMETLAHGIKPT